MSWETLLSAPRPGQHLVQFYRDEQFFAAAITRYLSEGLRRGEAVIAVLTEAHRDVVLDGLRKERCDADAALGGRLQLLDAKSTLKRLLREGIADPNAFRKALAPIIGESLRVHGRLRVFGEMVDLLWRDGRRDASARLEQLWNELAREQAFALFCAYRVDTLQRSIYGRPLECLCRSHSHVIPASDYAGFDAAVNEAALHVLGRPLAGMLSALSRRHKPCAHMPAGQAMLLWLGGNMPHTAEKVMRRARERLASGTGAAAPSFTPAPQVSASQ